MSSVTASTMDMATISRLMQAGQMKLVGATSVYAAPYQSGSGALSPGSITIPALTGSQIAVVYLEVYCTMYYASTLTGTLGGGLQAYLSASGTGLSGAVSIAHTIFSGASTTNTTTVVKNSAIATTTTGSQTISFSGNASGNGPSSWQGTAYGQASVFIYQPPF